MAQLGARTAATLATLALVLSGCGPGSVAIRATQTCEGGNLEDCKTRCSARDGMPCYKLGWLHERGREVEHSFQQAMTLYQQSCDFEWAQACRALGDLYWRGERVDLNRGKAIEYWDRACTLGLDVACPTQLERDIADGKLVAVTRDSGALSVTPAVGYQPGQVSTSAPSRPTAPSAPSAPSAP